MEHPGVSIVASLYNYHNYIANMVNSVLEQTYPYWELIIVDDASTDNPEEILAQFNDSRIKYTKLKENQGYSHARNEGIINSTGNFIAIVDADDMLTPTSIEVRLQALLYHSNYLWCHADGKKIDASGNLIQRRKKRKNRKERYGDTITHRAIHGGSLMMRRQFFLKLGLFDETLKFSSDNELIRRALKFKLLPYYVPEVVTYYRQHSKQMHKASEKKRIIEEETHIVRIKKQIITSVEKRYREGIHAGNTRLLEIK